MLESGNLPDQKTSSRSSFASAITATSDTGFFLRFSTRNCPVGGPSLPASMIGFLQDPMTGTLSSADLVERLAELPNLADIPREELEWLAAHGEYDLREAGQVIVPMDERIENLWIILSGHYSVWVDRGVGPKRVMSWRTGDVTGILPYSRMTGPPGDSFIEEESELLTIHERHFPEMIHRCPIFTAYTVHLMVDRARRFKASDLQDEKMISLGKLAAGLAHELDNPASATIRGAKLLNAALEEADAASRAVGKAGLTAAQRELVEQTRAVCVAERGDDVLSPIERADRESEIADWLARHDCDPDQSSRLAETDLRIENLDNLAENLSGDRLDAVLRWITGACETRSLADDIEVAATRIHGLVAAVKRFTQMDSLAAPEASDVGTGLRDTVRIISSRAKAKGVAITLDVEPDLPLVHAAHGELNQVWLNLIDNALDAVGEDGHIDVKARQELDRVVVSVMDDGPGIPPEIEDRIFDPFFTTKPPGQGIGLGLELTRRLVRRYHGDIEVHSDPGRTEFRVSVAVES
jgi:signal transduction histidine kinase